ncbi:TPA: DUF805 domain-containing protein [Raoultella planticola]|uniref:DUF805 domain-containing protein n=1 Tax=Raoultella planticola TaxID=575 RepID=UPI001A281027|nr:DUF805 domain-containing protein [Raoultella planticola]
MFFIKNVIEGYRKAFCYKGVADRKTYFFFWLFQLPAGLIIKLALAYCLYFLLFSGLSFNGLTIISGMGCFAILVALFYSWLAWLALSVRRLHDIGLSGWVLLIPTLISFAVSKMIKGDQGESIIAAIAIIFFLSLMLIKTKTKNNKYRLPTD